MLGNLLGAIIGAPARGKANKALKKVAFDQQNRSAEYMEKADKLFEDKYEIPEEVGSMYKMLLNKAKGKSALQSLLEERADKRESNRISQLGQYATSGAQALAMAGKISGETGQERIDAVIAGEKERNEFLDKSAQFSNILGGYQDKAYQYNVQEPRNMYWGEANALKSAGQQNYLTHKANKAKAWNEFGQALGGTIDEVASMVISGGLGGAGGGVPTYS